MIQSRAEMREYMAADKAALRITRRRPVPFFGMDLVWRQERMLRRCEYWHNCRRSVFGTLLYCACRVLLKRLSLKTGAQIPLNVCGKGLNLAHEGPVIINETARLGEYCRIQTCVSIGTAAGTSGQAPQIGNRVYIGPGAKLFGPIVLADGIAVGANAVVNRSFTEPGITIGGVPARKLSDKGSRGLLYTPEEGCGDE